LPFIEWTTNQIAGDKGWRHCQTPLYELGMVLIPLSMYCLLANCEYADNCTFSAANRYMTLFGDLR